MALDIPLRIFPYPVSLTDQSSIFLVLVPYILAVLPRAVLILLAATLTLDGSGRYVPPLSPTLRAVSGNRIGQSGVSHALSRPVTSLRPTHGAHVSDPKSHRHMMVLKSWSSFRFI